jgi:hypothetical protein
MDQGGRHLTLVLDLQGDPGRSRGAFEEFGFELATYIMPRLSRETAMRAVSDTLANLSRRHGSVVNFPRRIRLFGENVFLQLKFKHDCK